MITISEFVPNIYLIKLDEEISEDALKQTTGVVKIVDGKHFELKRHNHGLWILHLHDLDKV
jgi:hypothetical protein